MKNNLTALPQIWLLQLFAEPNTQTTLLNAPGNDLSPEMRNAYLVQELLRPGKPNLVHQQVCKHKPLPKGNSKTVNWRIFDNFPKAMTPLTEGVTPDGSKLNIRAVEAEVRQYGAYTELSDMLELTSYDPIIGETTKGHSANMAKTMDAIARNEMLTCPNVLFAPSVAPDGTVTPHQLRAELDENARVTPKLIARVVAYLEAVDAPKFDGMYVAIIHPHQKCDIMTSTGFVDMVKYQSVRKIFEGEIGELYGVRFLVSSAAKICKGENLTADSETVTNGGNEVARSNGSGTTTVTLAGAIQAGDHILEATADNPVLLNVNGVEFECVGATAGGSGKLQIQQPHEAIPASAVIYPGGAGKNNLAVYPMLILGEGAVGDVELSEEGADVIVKQRGSAGTADPLNQRSTIGWKATYCAKVLMPDYIYRLEACCEMGEDVEEDN